MAESMWKFPFGKHKGKGIEDVDSGYLEWIIGEDWFFKKFRHGAEQIAAELSYRSQHNLAPETDEDKEKDNGRSEEKEGKNEEQWW